LSWLDIKALGIADGPGASPWNVSVHVDDGFGHELTSPAVTLTVTNVDPTATFQVPATTTEGGSFVIGFSNPFDPVGADVAAGFLYSYDLNNDGDFADPNDLLNVPQASYTVSFAQNGNYTVRGRIQDKDGGYTDYTGSILITNAAPTATFAIGVAARSTKATRCRWSLWIHSTRL